MKFKVHHATPKRGPLESMFMNAVAIAFSALIGFAYYLFFPYFVLLVILTIYYQNTLCFSLLGLFIFACICPTWPSTRMAQSLPFRALAHYVQWEVYQAEPDDYYMPKKDQRKILYLTWPHGIISFGGLATSGICSEHNTPGKWGTTAVADIILRMPVLRSVFGWLNCASSSRSSMTRILKKDNCVLYPGGIAELFKSDPEEEHLFFKERLGCIRLALKSNVDIVPVYFMGNTQFFSILHHPFVNLLSRKLKMSICIFWGRWGLPIPRQKKIILGLGPRLCLPHIEKPEEVTHELVAEWHAKTMEACRDLFDSIKDKHPDFKDKKLYID